MIFNFFCCYGQNSAHLYQRLLPPVSIARRIVLELKKTTIKSSVALYNYPHNSCGTLGWSNTSNCQEFICEYASRMLLVQVILDFISLSLPYQKTKSEAMLLTALITWWAALEFYEYNHQEPLHSFEFIYFWKQHLI